MAHDPPCKQACSGKQGQNVSLEEFELDKNGPAKRIPSGNFLQSAINITTFGR